MKTDDILAHYCSLFINLPFQKTTRRLSDLLRVSASRQQTMFIRKYDSFILCCLVQLKRDIDLIFFYSITVNNSKGTISSWFFSVNKSLAVVIAQMLLNNNMYK